MPTLTQRIAEANKRYPPADLIKFALKAFREWDSLTRSEIQALAAHAIMNPPDRKK